jgi:hypothetical protein
MSQLIGGAGALSVAGPDAFKRQVVRDHEGF